MRDDHFDFRGHDEDDNPGQGRGHDPEFRASKPGRFLGHRDDDCDCPDALVFEPGTIVEPDGVTVDPDGIFDEGDRIAGSVIFDEDGCAIGNVFAA